VRIATKPAAQRQLFVRIDTWGETPWALDSYPGAGGLKLDIEPLPE
jgi:hypothetical protein